MIVNYSETADRSESAAQMHAPAGRDLRVSPALGQKKKEPASLLIKRECKRGLGFHALTRAM